MTTYATFNIKLQSSTTGRSIESTGGKLLVVLNGQYKKATLYNPDSAYASLTNATSFTSGAARFAIEVTGGALSQSVDLYGCTPDGQWFVYEGALPGSPTEIYVDTARAHQCAVLPFSYVDAGAAAAEYNTGFTFPAGAVIDPNGPFIDVKAIDATETIDVGLLSSDSGGDADGFIVGLSIGTLGRVIPTMVSGSVTVGALLQVTSAVGAVTQQKVVTSTPRISLTLSSGADTGEGLIYLPHRIPLV